MKHESVPLPTHLHVVLTEQDIGRKDVFLIGDVHGCLDELRQLLQKAGVSSENHVIIFCGDLVNKGPKSQETVNFVRQLGAGVYSVRGNHEENIINVWLKAREAQAKGEEFQMKKKYRWCVSLTETDADYLMNLPYTISIPSLGAIVVHAGLVPGQPLERQLPCNMVRMRNILKERDTDGKTMVATEEYDQGTSWAQLWPGPTHVYFGHDARRGLQRHQFATGLDTACVMGHQLTGIFLKGARSGEIVSVQSVSTARALDSD